MYHLKYIFKQTSNATISTVFAAEVSLLIPLPSLLVKSRPRPRQYICIPKFTAYKVINSRKEMLCFLVHILQMLYILYSTIIKQREIDPFILKL